METVYRVTKEISYERSGQIMTIAEKLIKEGMKKGLCKLTKEIRIPYILGIFLNLLINNLGKVSIVNWRVV